MHVSEDGAAALAVYQQPAHATKAMMAAGMTPKEAEGHHDELLKDSAATVVYSLAQHFKISVKELLEEIEKRMDGVKVCQAQGCQCAVCRAERGGMMVDPQQGKPS
jgi:predicted membrane GTPase involved in stress response